ncbi:hypothetical protein LCGC14_2689300 [marine sediment metagenome]|uniref:Uncharacterized protein n=1 Tax=marine sediment metagenome TaxID=412755 RepID=A0A0F8ZIZ7_9ZZZZ
MSSSKETVVFIGAYVPVETASKLTLASASSGFSPIKVSKSDIVRAALKEHLDRLSPSPSSRMVSHLLSEWHTLQAAPAKRKITFESYCKKAQTDMIAMRITRELATDIYDRLKQFAPTVEAQ